MKYIMLSQKRVLVGVIGLVLLLVVGTGVVMIKKIQDTTNTEVVETADPSQLRREGAEPSVVAEAFSESAENAEELTGDYYEQSGYYFYQARDYEKAKELYTQAKTEYEKQEGRESDIVRVEARIIELQNLIDVLNPASATE